MQIRFHSPIETAAIIVLPGFSLSGPVGVPIGLVLFFFWNLLMISLLVSIYFIHRNRFQR